MTRSRPVWPTSGRKCRALPGTSHKSPARCRAPPPFSSIDFSAIARLVAALSAHDKLACLVDNSSARRKYCLQPPAPSSLLSASSPLIRCNSGPYHRLSSRSIFARSKTSSAFARPAREGHASRKLCLQDPVENSVACRGQLLKTRVEHCRRCADFSSSPYFVESLHAETKALVVLQSVFSRVVGEFVHECLGLAVIWICQICDEACKSQRPAKVHGPI